MREAGEAERSTPHRSSASFFGGAAAALRLVRLGPGRRRAGSSSGRRRRGRRWDPGPSSAAIRRDPSRTTKTLPSGVEASTWVTSRPAPPTVAARASELGAPRRPGGLPARPASVEPATSPASSNRTAASTWEEISVRSASACVASIGVRGYHGANWHRCVCESGPCSRSSSPTAAPTSPRWSPTSPCSRSSRSSSSRSRCSASPTARTRPTSSSSELSQAFPGSSLAEHPHARPHGAGQRGHARDRRRRRPPLVVAVALQLARVGVQHRLRPAEPLLPAREGARRRGHGRLAS